MATEYQRMRAEGQVTEHGPRRVQGLDPKVAKERAAERSRRNSEARRRTLLVLAHRHPAEFRELFEQEMAGLAEERGPLPGDPV